MIVCLLWHQAIKTRMKDIQNSKAIAGSEARRLEIPSKNGLDETLTCPDLSHSDDRLNKHTGVLLWDLKYLKIDPHSMHLQQIQICMTNSWKYLLSSHIFKSWSVPGGTKLQLFVWCARSTRKPRKCLTHLKTESFDPTQIKARQALTLQILVICCDKDSAIYFTTLQSGGDEERYHYAEEINKVPEERRVV